MQSFTNKPKPEIKEVVTNKEDEPKAEKPVKKTKKRSKKNANS